ncbi:hypothetical protein C8T65DRAFT_835328 [Cerioporus squamosus]|nr:hypothetical protein C8T65DRAFT_835328 [Cerioporus squamosus]
MRAALVGPLPLDVWNLVYDELDEHGDVLSLMFTCGALYALGNRPLLGLFACFDSVYDLRSFCDFVLGDVARRPGYLRKLAFTIDLPRFRDEDEAQGEEEGQGEEDEAELLLRIIPDLARVLAGAARLRELRIGFAEELLQYAEMSVARGICPTELRLSNVIASLHSVTTFDLASFGPRTTSHLQTMSSPLRMVDIKFYSTRPNSHANFHQNLSRYRNTLTWISV